MRLLTRAGRDMVLDENLPARRNVVKETRPSLYGGEELPHASGELQLEDPAFIGVEEVGPLRDSVGTGRAHAASLPSDRAHAPAMLLSFGAGLDPVLHTVLHTCGSCRH